MLCLDALSSLFSSSPMTLSADSSCDLLILGAGWTFSFLASHIAAEHPSLSYIATTRDGRNGTLKWAWDAEQEGHQQYEALPRAKTVLITYPIKGEGGSKRMVEGYEAVHGAVRWIQLGSTGIFDVSWKRYTGEEQLLTACCARSLDAGKTYTRSKGYRSYGAAGEGAGEAQAQVDKSTLFLRPRQPSGDR